MNERTVIEAEPREVIGKGVGQLRRDGWIPGVVYGRKSPVSVQMEQKALRRALRVVGTANLADLSIGGKTRTVLVREIQQHATRGDIVHVDFLEVDMKVKLKAMVELVSEGVAQLEADGLGDVTVMLREVEVECLPDDLVAAIHFDATAIQTPEDVIHVRDLVAPKGVEILSDPDLVVARFEYVTLETEEEEEEGIIEEEEDAEDVEVIARGKKDEEEEF